MRGPRHGNGRPHLIGRKNTNPLQKIVSTEWDQYERRIEVLECGHMQVQRQDMIGPTKHSRVLEPQFVSCRFCRREVSTVSSEWYQHLRCCKEIPKTLLPRALRYSHRRERGD